MRFTGKVAVVTGGSKGIGKAIAVALAKEGADVAITARNPEDLKTAENEILRLGTKVLSIRCDVQKRADVESMAKQVLNELGAPSILINNAGVGKFREIVNMSDEDFRSILETNLFGVFYCTRAFLPSMIEKQEGHIVNIGSLAGKNNFAGGSAYCASKHALISFGECLMLEVRQKNIKVTTICPGSVQTEFGDRLSEKNNWALTSDDVANAVLDVLNTSPGSLISLVDLRPLKPQKH